MTKFANVRFTGVNLSHQQCTYMRAKNNDPRSQLSSGRFTLVEGDLNDIEFAEKFDKIVSVGVLPCGQPDPVPAEVGFLAQAQGSDIYPYYHGANPE
jgi:hypothetical protein